MESVNSVHPDVYSGLLRNIILTGGNSKIPGFIERLQKEVNQISDCFVEPVIRATDDLNLHHRQLEKITLGSDFCELVITKKMYSEMGNSKAINLF